MPWLSNPPKMMNVSGSHPSPFPFDLDRILPANKRNPPPSDSSAAMCCVVHSIK
jgi:hypothetical protein